MPQADLEGRAGRRVQPDGIEALARIEVADLVAQAEGLGAGRRGQVQEVCRGQGHPLGPAQPLQEIGLQGLLEQ